MIEAMMLEVLVDILLDETNENVMEWQFYTYSGRDYYNL